MSDTLKYQVILADPPWRYRDQKNNDPAMGGITYPTMRDEDIYHLPVINIADTDSALFLWATGPKMAEAIHTVESWGFRYVTIAFCWRKLNKSGTGVYSGLGHWTNSNEEYILLGRRGTPKRAAKNVKQIIDAPIAAHSVKPQEAHRRIEMLMGTHTTRIELFARRRVPGWVTTGLDLDGTNIQEFLTDEGSHRRVLYALGCADRQACHGGVQRSEDASDGAGDQKG
jgi:N6-adenosine-specific RNA methylase IME4